MFPHLVDLCLDSVAKNLERFDLLFTTSEDFHTKRKQEFLQKKYSSGLISRVCKEGALPDQFIDMLVNGYSRFLDTRWFQKCPLDRLTSKLAEIGCDLEKIVCRPECMKDGFLEALRESVCHLIHLKSFTFRFKCNDWILRNVAKFCPHIEEIDVYNSPITSEGVRYLCRDRDGKCLCRKLKELCFGENKDLSHSDVVYLLKHLPSLEIVIVPRLPPALYWLHKKNFDKVAPYNITTLNFIPFYFEIVKVCVSVCPRLKNFSCELNKEEQLSSLFHLPELEQLHLVGKRKINDLEDEFNNCIRHVVIQRFSLSNLPGFEHSPGESISEINLNRFLMPKGRRLTSLSVESCTVSVSVLAENCPCLKELILNATQVLGDEDSEPVFNSLSSLTFIDYNYIPHSKAIQLMLSSSLVKLDSLSFKNCDLKSPEQQGLLLKCCELYPIKNMSFYKSLIEKEFIEHLLRICRDLLCLTLDDCVNYGDREDLLRFAERLPNKPNITISRWMPPVWLYRLM